MKLRTFKKTWWYREVWYFYHSVIVFRNGTYFGYLRHRFFTRYKIRHAAHPLDRAPSDESYSIHLLCSHKDIDMLLWSLASWHRVVQKSGQIYVHEDGSFTDDDRKLLSRVLPQVKIIDLAWANEQAETWLAALPYTLAVRKNYKKHILILKLIDPRFVSHTPKRLILDTDLVWFTEPTLLLDALKQGTSVMQYGGTALEQFPFTDGSALSPELSTLNSGMVTYTEAMYDERVLETYCSKISPGKHNHFVEQAGYAWILSQKTTIQTLPKDAYVIWGPPAPGVVVKHFTGPRREDFWREGVAVVAPYILQ